MTTTAPVVACGYEISLDDDNNTVRELVASRAFVTVPKEVHTVKMGLYFGSGSVGAPITKTDAEIRAWFETQPSACSLRLVEIYIKGIVFGKFVDGDGVEFLGAICDLRNEKQRKKEGGVMKAKELIHTFAPLGIKPCDVRAEPYLWCRE